MNKTQKGTHLIHLRPATEDAIAFGYRVKKEAIGEYVTQIWGWDEAFPQEFHARDFEEVRLDIVVYQDLYIGILEIRRQSDHIYLGEFYLLPQFQRQGIVTFLLQRVVEEAQSARLPVRLDIFQSNLAQALYKRDGFVIGGQRGHHFLMERPVL